MKSKPNPLKLWVIAAAITCVPVLQAEVVTLFQDAADLEGLAVTNSTNSDTVPVNSFTTPASALDGDALRHWDFDDAGRSTLRYRPDMAVTEGIQYSFDAYIDAASTGAILMRVGNDSASLAGIKGSGISLRIESSGDVIAEIPNLAEGGWVGEVYEGVVAVATPFNITIVYNAAMEGDLAFSLGGSDLTLAPQTWALFLDDALLGTDLPGLSAASTGDGSWNFDPASGAQDVWWLTGGASAESGMDFQLDNILVKTGTDIGGGGGGADTWGGYDIVNEIGDVNTGDWMSWINVANAPYILSYSTGGWIYMEEPAPDSAGAWAYFFK